MVVSEAKDAETKSVNAHFFIFFHFLVSPFFHVVIAPTLAFFPLLSVQTPCNNNKEHRTKQKEIKWGEKERCFTLWKGKKKKKKV